MTCKKSCHYEENYCCQCTIFIRSDVTIHCIWRLNPNNNDKPCTYKRVQGFSHYTNYLEVVNTYLAALDAGSTVASWNTIGNTSVM